MSSRDDDHDQSPIRRLRVPAALVVAFVGTSAAVSMWYGGCGSDTNPPPDAIIIESRVDAAVEDASLEDALVDAGNTPDAPRDAAPPDTPPV